MTTLHFHTGRGGRFYNADHRVFKGVKTIEEVLIMADSNGQWVFTKPENYYEITMKLSERGADNLLSLLQNDPEKFENKTGIEVGDMWYFDQNGTPLISEEEVNTGVGILNWDNEYDTDEVMYLRDSDQNDLELILDSNEWNKEDLIKEYFDEWTDVEIDWNRFNGNYEGLISWYFSGRQNNIDELYEEE